MDPLAENRANRRWLVRRLAELAAVLLFVGLLASLGLTARWFWEEALPDTTRTALRPLDPLPPTPLGGAPVLRRRLLIPVKGVAPNELRDTFDAPRGGGRLHEAIDILAPRGTPVCAAAGGVILRLHRGGAGGRAIYQLSRDSTRVFYYAHLAAYADDLARGDRVRRGEVIGTVGASGNAPDDAPHLHFAIWKISNPEHFWNGPAVNPYPLLVSDSLDL